MTIYLRGSMVISALLILGLPHYVDGVEPGTSRTSVDEPFADEPFAQKSPPPELQAAEDDDLVRQLERAHRHIRSLEAKLKMLRDRTSSSKSKGASSAGQKYYKSGGPWSRRQPNTEVGQVDIQRLSRDVEELKVEIAGIRKQIVSLLEAVASLTGSESDDVFELDSIDLKVFRLKHADVDSTVALMRSLLRTKDVILAADKRSDAIFVRVPKEKADESIKWVKAIIEVVDVEPKD